MNLTNITFQGKTVVITGGTQGIGKCIATQCAEMGGKVILLGRNKEKAEAVCAEIGTDKACYYTVDLGNCDDVVTVFEKIVEEHKVDVLINNAGIVNTDSFTELSLENWNKVINTDLTAVFLACQVVFKQMEVNGGGRIVKHTPFLLKSELIL